jgi:glutaredoxin
MYVIYSKPGCAHCEQAKALLKSKGLFYEELILDVGQDKREDSMYYTIDRLKELVPGVKTVPQIFDGEKLIGGFSALKQHLA